MADKVMSETERLIAACKRTSQINRGMYPVTKATNVFMEDGSPLEEPPAQDEGEKDENT